MATVPSKLPSVLCSASIPPITGWPVTRLIISFDTAMSLLFLAAWKTASCETFRPRAIAIAEQTTRPLSSMRVRLEK